MTPGHEGPLDLLFVGGGLANALLAYRMRLVRPDLNVLVLEAGATFGGNHTWSFHQTDLTPDQDEWTAPFVVHRWPSYDVAFPDVRREVELAYCSATSERLHGVLSGAGIPVRFGTVVRRVSPTDVLLDGGETLRAGAVIDGRGPIETPHMRFGWQKFHGLEIRSERPHGVVRPTLMDATVEQQDGYRFVYVLPFAPDRLLIEDTYYSDTSDVRPDLLAARIHDYVAAKGWGPVNVLRDETGVLPITLSGNPKAFWDAKEGQPAVGLRAGLFHPTTGFSWPEAVRLADHLARGTQFSAGPLFATIRRYAEARWRQQSFFRVLDRLLFLASASDRRWRVLQRFYQLSDPTIARFYAGRLRLDDKLRLLVGKPPVPIPEAIRAILDSSVA